MKLRTLVKNPLLWLVSCAVGAAVAVACSSSTTPAGESSSTDCTVGDVVSCDCPDGTPSTAKCDDPSSCACGQANDPDSGQTGDDDSGHNGDGGHVDDGASPEELYGACAKPGSFGAICTAPNALDRAECTDPNFPYCFGGAQGFWCTAYCGTVDAGEDASDDAGEDAAPTGFAACLVDVPDGGFPDAAAEGGANQGCLPTACNAKGYCK